MSAETRLRMGLVGTGYWARETHAQGIADSSRAVLAAVWGRDHAAASDLAQRHGAQGYATFDELLRQVDAVSFSVPPDVQAPLAARAAAAGKHLLLEKPMALDESAAEEIVAAVRSSGVAALVFFTHLFSAPATNWFLGADQSQWLGGDAYWLGSALCDDNPFNTPWRRTHGGLWDVGPHAVADLSRALGPVVTVTADAGASDVTHLVLHHEIGASSTCTLTLSAPDAADGFSLMLWGPTGRSYLPIAEVDSVRAHTTAVDELVSLVRSGDREHPADVRLGQEVVRILADAQRQLDAGAGT